MTAALLFGFGVVTTNTHASDFTLEVTTHLGDRQHFRAGEQISFLASTNKNAYLLMVYHDAAGHLIQILPNRVKINSQYPAGDYFSIPDNNDVYVFEIQAPYGQETLYTYAFSTPVSEPAGKALANGFKVLDGDWRDVSRRLKAQQGFLGEHRLVITTGP